MIIQTNYIFIASVAVTIISAGCATTPKTATQAAKTVTQAAKQDYSLIVDSEVDGVDFLIVGGRVRETFTSKKDDVKRFNFEPGRYRLILSKKYYPQLSEEIVLGRTRTARYTISKSAWQAFGYASMSYTNGDAQTVFLSVSNLSPHSSWARDYEIPIGTCINERLEVGDYSLTVYAKFKKDITDTLSITHNHEVNRIDITSLLAFSDLFEKNSRSLKQDHAYARVTVISTNDTCCEFSVIPAPQAQYLRRPTEQEVVDSINLAKAKIAGSDNDTGNDTPGTLTKVAGVFLHELSMPRITGHTLLDLTNSPALRVPSSFVLPAGKYSFNACGQQHDIELYSDAHLVIDLDGKSHYFLKEDEISIDFPYLNAFQPATPPAHQSSSQSSESIRQLSPNQAATNHDRPGDASRSLDPLGAIRKPVWSSTREPDADGNSTGEKRSLLPWNN